MLDFEYAKALAEVVLDTTCSEKEREVRLECSTQIFGRANAYLKKGFLPDVVEAFFVRKMKGLPLVSTKQDMQDFLKVSTPHYFGGKFTVSNIPYYSEEEELLQKRRDDFMIKKVRIAVDHGNRNMKTCSQVFTTGLTIQDKKPARGEKFLFYEGKYYVLSENRIPYQRDKTQDDRFFILTLFAIVKELEENPQIQPEDVIQVDLPIGLPPKHYAELCERYEAYFKRQGKIHDINYCGRTYHITIGEVMAFPQDYAAMMTMIEKLQQIPKVVGIDIGGFTTDYLLMRKGNPDMEACDSMEKGVITMYNKIISGINSEYDILLEESDIDSILQGNTEFYEEAVVRMTEGMVQKGLY